MKLSADIFMHVNQSEQLKKLTQQHFLKMFAEIRWDPSSFLKEVTSVFRPSPCRDDVEIFSFASFTFAGEVKAASNIRAISGIVVAANNSDRFIDILAQEAKIGAQALANQVLEAMGTDFRKERDRWFKNAKQRSMQQMPLPTQFVVPPDMEEDVRRMMEQINSPANFGSFGMPPIVVDPNMPKDQVAVVSNGKVVGMAKNVSFAEPQEEETTKKEEDLESLIRRREKDAPWK